MKKYDRKRKQLQLCKYEFKILRTESERTSYTLGGRWRLYPIFANIDVPSLTIQRGLQLFLRLDLRKSRIVDPI